MGYGHTSYTCGFCGNTYVSGNKNGPSKTILEDCGDTGLDHSTLQARETQRRLLGVRLTEFDPMVIRLLMAQAGSEAAGR